MEGCTMKRVDLSAMPDSRRIFIWRNKDDGNRLADVVCEAAATELFGQNGELVALNAGQLTPIGLNDLRDIIARHIATIQLVSQGTAGWKYEHVSFTFPSVADASRQPNQQVLLDLFPALLARVAKAPGDIPQLSEQQMQEVRHRLRIGEPRASIARAYGLDAEMLARL
jgi:hypothetical protein